MKKALSCVAMIVVSSFSMAEIYKWTDANGQVHYSDQKPATVKDVEEPFNKLNNIKSDVTEADILRYLPGRWQINEETKTRDGESIPIEGQMLFFADGRVTSALIAKYPQLDVPATSTGSWYISHQNRINTNQVLTIQGIDVTQNSTQLVLEINDYILTSRDKEGQVSTLRRVVDEPTSFFDQQDDELNDETEANDEISE